VATIAKDVFICQASEDKQEVAQPLFQAFRDSNISSWYDEVEIRWGDSIPKKINQGMRISTYVVVVLSRAFLDKNWPEREMNAALNKEAASGEVKLLPLLVGNKQDRDAIIEHYPLLNDKFHMVWTGQVPPIVQAIKARLKKQPESSRQTDASTRQSTPSRNIPMPKLKREFTQRDRDKFLQEAFTAVESYFQAALANLKQETDEVETDLTTIHKFKLICKIYIRGEIKNRCKIWLGGLHGSDSIAYHEGESYIDFDSSMNDWLTVNDDGHQLGFEASGMWRRGEYSEKKHLTVEDAAEYRWQRLTDRLTGR
jgi:hypothetical protein